MPITSITTTKNIVSNTDYVFKFGKHKGETVEDILNCDPGYILWMDENYVRRLSCKRRKRENMKTPTSFFSNLSNVEKVLIAILGLLIGCLLCIIPLRSVSNFLSESGRKYVR